MEEFFLENNDTLRCTYHSANYKKLKVEVDMTMKGRRIGVDVNVAVEFEEIENGFIVKFHEARKELFVG